MELFDTLEAINDVRVVGIGRSYITDWERGASSEYDTWKLAERIVSQRQRGILTH